MKQLRPIIAALMLIPMSLSLAYAEIREASGKVTMLRVHDVGTKYGPPADQIDVEVVFWLSNDPGKAFGFQLRNDNNRAAREGMLAVLRDAFTVTTTGP